MTHPTVETNPGPDTEYECPTCCRWAPWTDGSMRSAGDPVDEFWCQNCGQETLLSACASRVVGEGGAR